MKRKDKKGKRYINAIDNIIFSLLIEVAEVESDLDLVV